MENGSIASGVLRWLWIFTIPFLPGCATLALSALGAGAGAGIPYVIADCADRTFNYPYDLVNRAVPVVLHELDIAMVETIPTQKGEKIKALANELDITIEMEKITEKATRITVNATKRTVIKDRATAEEIINQFERTLTGKKGA
jgi:hypothetical protein